MLITEQQSFARFEGYICSRTKTVRRLISARCTLSVEDLELYGGDCGVARLDDVAFPQES
jgi:hypothetical protein